MKYLAFGRDGHPLACVLFGSAAWRVAARGAFIGSDEGTRRRRLHWVANNMRFLTKLAWLWAFVTASFVYFTIAASSGSKVLRAVLETCRMQVEGPRLDSSARSACFSESASGRETLFLFGYGRGAKPRGRDGFICSSILVWRAAKKT